jgi:hypothetical protein
MSKANEWDLLRRQFDALMHDESEDAESIDEIFDIQFRRRFTELIDQLPNVIAQVLVITGPEAKTRNVRFWPKADMDECTVNVRL